MSEEMIDLFKKLNKDEKRNEFSSLLVKTDKLLEELLDRKTCLNAEVKNYDQNLHKNMNEEEIILFFYEDLWTIKNKILELIIREKNNQMR